MAVEFVWLGGGVAKPSAHLQSADATDLVSVFLTAQKVTSFEGKALTVFAYPSLTTSHCFRDLRLKAVLNSSQIAS